MVADLQIEAEEANGGVLLTVVDSARLTMLLTRETAAELLDAIDACMKTGGAPDHEGRGRVEGRTRSAGVRRACQHRRRFVDVRRGARLGRGRSGRRVGGSAGVAGSDGKARPGLRSDGPGPFSGRFSSPRRPGP